MPGEANGGEFGQDFADHAAEFEAMAAEAAGHVNLRVAGMRADDEMRIGRHGVETGLGLCERSVEPRQKIPQSRAQILFVRLSNGAFDRFRRADLFCGAIVK